MILDKFFVISKIQVTYLWNGDDAFFQHYETEILLAYAR